SGVKPCAIPIEAIMAKITHGSEDFSSVNGSSCPSLSVGRCLRGPTGGAERAHGIGELAASRREHSVRRRAGEAAQKRQCPVHGGISQQVGESPQSRLRGGHRGSPLRRSKSQQFAGINLA